MKLNLGKQIVTVENRNLDSIIEQCLEQKIKEKVTEVSTKLYYEIDNRTLSDICYKVKGIYTIDEIMRVYENVIAELLNKTQY